MVAVDTLKNVPSGAPPVVAITMGCPVGIGPEIILRFLAEERQSLPFRPVVIGEIGVLQRCARELRFRTDITAWQPGDPVAPGTIGVREPRKRAGIRLQAEKLQWGVPTADTGAAAGACIEEAVQLLATEKLAAMVTCPVSKHALQLGGYPFPGHTEMLASLCGTENFGMMMAGSRLRVSLVTIHTPLAKVVEQLSRAEIRRIVALTGETLQRDFGIARPRIAVAGLNPHGGESGLFGAEEKTVIEPALRGVGSAGWEVTGPLPPDTVFKMALDGMFDAVVAMYHDQGLIPFKLVHFADGVNLTMGLPIVRTSVDHGTAYDIAGQGKASASSLEAACAMAARIVAARQKNLDPEQ